MKKSRNLRGSLVWFMARSILADLRRERKARVEREATTRRRKFRLVRKRRAKS